MSRRLRPPPIDAQSQTLQRIDGSKVKATKKKSTKKTRDRAAKIAGHLLKTSSNREVLTVAASAEEDAGFKAGKDL